MLQFANEQEDFAERFLFIHSASKVRHLFRPVILNLCAVGELQVCHGIFRRADSKHGIF